MLKLFDVLVLPFYCALIYWLSDQPTLPMPMVFEIQDKLMHFAAYFIMSGLAWRAFRHFIPMPRVLMVASILYSSLYGALDEWHQSFVEGRNPSGLDWAADTVGAIAAMLLLAQFFRLQRQSPT